MYIFQWADWKMLDTLRFRVSGNWLLVGSLVATHHHHPQVSIFSGLSHSLRIGHLLGSVSIGHPRVSKGYLMVLL